MSGLASTAADSMQAFVRGASTCFQSCSAASHLGIRIGSKLSLDANCVKALLCCRSWVEVAEVSGHRTLWAIAVVGDALDQALDVLSGQPTKVCGIFAIRHASNMSHIVV